MNLLRRARIAFGLTIVVMLCCGQVSPPLAQGTSRPISLLSTDAYQHAFLNALRPALYAAGRQARVDYQASCEPVTGKVLFPSTAVHPLPPHRPLDLAAFREMFVTDKNVVVSEAAPGIVSVRIGHMSDALLHTRIPELIFYARMDRYSPQGVFYELKMNGTVRASMKQIGVRPANYVSEFLTGERVEGFPHLPSEMRDATVEQVLDRVARTFNGVVLYGTCTNPPVFLLQFVPLVDFPLATPN
jgi:hypothetical protein